MLVVALGGSTRFEPAPSVESPQRPSRIALFPPLLSAYATIAGSAEPIVASSAGEKELATTGILGHVFPRLKDISLLSTVGGRSAVPSDPESVLALDPDLTVTWAWATGGLEKLGTPLAVIRSVDPVAMWRDAAKSLRDEVEIERLVRFYNSQLAHLRTMLDHYPDHSPHKLLLVWKSGTGQWRAAGRNHRVMSDLSRLGIADSIKLGLPLDSGAGSLPIDIEAIIDFDPDILVLPCCTSEDDMPESIYNDRALKSVSAVRNRRVYKAPSGGARMDGLVEYPLLLHWYAAIVYPELDLGDWRARFRSAYREIYAYDVSDRDMERLLSVNDNSNSAHFRRLFMGCADVC
jgi:iron complex transport system substrate-binding protein